MQTETNEEETPRPEETYRSPRTRAKLATFGLIVYGAGLIFTATTAFAVRDALVEIERGESVTQDELLALSNRADQMAALWWLLVAVAATLFCVWLHRAARNIDALGGNLSVTPGGAVGYFFVPIANIWRPYQIVGEVWRKSDGSGRHGDLAGGSPTPALITGWWLCWLFARIGAWFTDLRVSDTSSQEEIADAILVSTVFLGLEGVALALAIAVVWSVTRRQEAAAHTFPVASARR